MAESRGEYALGRSLARHVPGSEGVPAELPGLGLCEMKRKQAMTHHTAHPIPSRIHPQALLSILSIAGWSQYSASRATSEERVRTRVRRVNSGESVEETRWVLKGFGFFSRGSINRMALHGLALSHFKKQMT